MNRGVLPMALALLALGCAGQEGDARPGLEASPGAEAAERPALAEASNQTLPLGVQVLDARRIAADTLRVELAVINRAPASAPAPELAAIREAVAAFENLSVVGPAGQRRFFPLRGPSGRTVWSGIEVPGPGERRHFWAVFPAPAGATSRVTVVVPGMPPMRGVPVS